jgi:hypothetical protein
MINQSISFDWSHDMDILSFDQKCIHYSPEQFFNYPADVTITDDRAANLYLCLALMAFSSEGSFFSQHLV